MPPVVFPLRLAAFDRLRLLLLCVALLRWLPLLRAGPVEPLMGSSPSAGCSSSLFFLLISFPMRHTCFLLLHSRLPFPEA